MSTRHATWMRIATLTVALAAAGCSGDDATQNPGAADPDPSRGVTTDQPSSTPDCGDTCQLEQAVTSGPPSAQLRKDFDAHYKTVEGMSYEKLLEQHRLAYHDGLDFEVAQAAHYNGFTQAFKLSSDATATLDKLGFVVVPAPALELEGISPPPGAGPADVYYRVFQADLPVFISADSILHAWHRSFDKLLEVTEQTILLPVLDELLSETIEVLEKDDGRAALDALFYLAVARHLLDPKWSVPTAVKDEVARFAELVEARTPAKTAFMGADTQIDFSQFIARGHYTRSPELKRYFAAMMWLGRTDLVLYDPDETSEPRPREEASARALAAAMARGDATSLFDRLNGFYAAFVGRTNAITPKRLLELCEQAQLAQCKGDAAVMQPHYAEQPPPEYSSRAFTDVPPISMRFFPQRFAYGSWVTAQTTTPRLKPGSEGGRSMAMPEDVAFALGNSRAVEYFADDMRKPLRQNLPATLEAVRLTVSTVPPAQLDSTAHNHWLEALRALSQPTLKNNYPQVMRTAAWHDRKLEAVLASWTELRHDTIMVAEQSTGGAACEYPRGYVEPVPELYTSLSAAIAAVAQAYEQLGELPRYMRTVPTFLMHFQTTLATLAGLANKELAQQPMTAGQVDFLNQTVEENKGAYPGVRSFDGWYPKLYWQGYWSAQSVNGTDHHPSALSEPIVADVHTDAEHGLALEVGVSHPGLMVVAIDSEGDLSLYGGPVANYYSFQVATDKRMTDEQWVERISRDDLPERPPFARQYHTP